MSLDYVQEKLGEAHDRLVVAKDIKSGLREAVQLCIAAMMHSGDIPEPFRQDLLQIVAESTKRSNPQSEMGTLNWTIHGMRTKTAQGLAARIAELYEAVRDL